MAAVLAVTVVEERVWIEEQAFPFAADAVEAWIVAPVWFVAAEPGVSEAVPVAVVRVSHQAALDETAVGAELASVEPDESAVVQVEAAAVEQDERLVVVAGQA